MLVTLANGTMEHYDDEPFAQGGQGALHLSKDRRWVIKLYHETDSSRAKALHQIIENYDVTKQDASAAALFAWPNAIVRAPRLGVRMANVNLQLEHRPLTWWIGARAYKRLPPAIRGNWLDRILIAASMARIAWLLHATGLCHSDFSGDNFLANVANHHTVLIDLDSLVVPDVLPPEMLGTGDYMAPEIVMGRLRPGKGAGPSIYTDLHSLAVLIYQLLLMRHPLKGPKQHDLDSEKDDLLALGERALYIEDPNDPSNRPTVPFNGAWLLGEEVEMLMRRAFTVGLRSPTQRPLAAEWGDALTRMIEQTVPCANPECDGKAFVLLRDQPAVCPWCGTKLDRPAQVPVLRLYDGAGQAGHYQAGRGRVVGWQSRKLHRWHVQPGLSERAVTRPEERRPVAEFQLKGSKWLLANLSIPDLRVVARGGVRQVAVNESLTLEHGQQLILGGERAARLALVAMQRL
jgi:DNA-binding helix-hairpin-helix protein with protein kinase domain